MVRRGKETGGGREIQREERREGEREREGGMDRSNRGRKESEKRMRKRGKTDRASCLQCLPPQTFAKRDTGLSNITSSLGLYLVRGFFE